MKLFTVSIGKLLKNKFSLKQTRRLHSCIHVSTSRLMWSFHSNVRHTHRFEAEGDTGVNSQVHMRPKAHPVCLKAQRFVVILSAHK